jgi:hypothetical protein
MALSAVGNILLVSSMCAAVLLVCIGVRGCGWPSSMSIWHIEMAVFALMKSAPTSASAVDDLTAQIICEILKMAPLLKGILSFLAINMCHPVRL